MNLKSILSTVLAATMLGASISPAIADDKGKGKGKKKGHYKNGKASGYHQSDWKRNRDRDDDRDRDSRYRDDDWRRSEDYRRSQEYQRNRAYGSNDNRSNYELDRLSDQRQKTKNEWRNIAYVSGGVALLGLLKKDNRLVFAGAAGTLYSLYRYEQDRKSQSSVDRLRASYFSRPYFERDGQRFDRRVVTRDGNRYYQFVRR